MIQLVAFRLDDQCYALELAAVDRVVRAVAITPLPKAPEIVLGVINVQGEIVPVVNVRKRFGLAARELAPADQMLIAHGRQRRMALVTGGVTGVLERPDAAIIGAPEILPRLEYLAGVVKVEDGLLLIHDLDRFLSLEEDRGLDEALRQSNSLMS